MGWITPTTKLNHQRDFVQAQRKRFVRYRFVACLVFMASLIILLGSRPFYIDVPCACLASCSIFALILLELIVNRHDVWLDDHESPEPPKYIMIVSSSAPK